MKWTRQRWIVAPRTFDAAAFRPLWSSVARQVIAKQLPRGGDDQAGTAQAAVGEGAEELVPEHLCFAGLDRDAQNLSAPVQIDRYSHYGGDGDDPAGPANLDVGGIEPDVGPFAFQWPIQKGIDPFVDLAAKPRNLAFRHAGHAHGLDQVID